MSAHLHREYVPGCYRCDLSRDEVMRAAIEDAENDEANEETRPYFKPQPPITPISSTQEDA